METANKGYFSPESLAAGVRAEGFAKAQPGNESVSGNVLKPQRQEGNVRSVSFFLAPAANTKPLCAVTLEELASFIKGSYVNAEASQFCEQLRRRSQKAITVTGQLRGMPNDKTRRAQFKKCSFDYVTFSGTFEKRADTEIASDSNLICIDFDHLGTTEDVNNVKEKILGDWLFQTVLLFVSPSGDGLKWVINKTNRGEYDNRAYYSAILNYLKQQYNIDADPQCCNISRGCYLPHDPDVVYIPLDQYLKDNEEEYFNPADWLLAETFPSTGYTAEADSTDAFEKYDKECGKEWDKERVRRLVDEVEKRVKEGNFPDDYGYGSRVSVGFALAHTLGEDGRTFFHRLCSLFPGYEYGDFNRQYNGYLKAERRDNEIGLGTLFKYAKEAGISPEVWGDVQTEEVSEKQEGPIIPLSITEESSSGETVERHLLEADLENMVERMADAMQCPKDFILSSMLAAMSVAIGTRIKVTDGTYINYPLLWLCIVAPSGSNKSEPLKRILRPIQEMDRQLYDEYQIAYAAWKDAESKGRQPKAGCTIISDTTPESRNMALADNPRGILWYCDELSTLLGNIGRYTKSGEQAQMLSLWDGDTIKVDRKGDGVLRIDKPFCSIVATTQPGVMASMMKGEEFTVSGFNPRWLFCYPKELPKRRYSKNTFTNAELEPWKTLVANIYGKLSGIEPENPIVASLNDDAESRYMTFWNELQERVDKAGLKKDDYLSSIFSKAQIQTLRLSLIIHVLRCGRIPDCKADDEPSVGFAADAIPLRFDIDGPSMGFAIETMKGFIRCAVRVKNDIESGGSRVSKRELFQSLKDYYPKMTQNGLAKGLGITQQAVNKMFLRMNN